MQVSKEIRAAIRDVPDYPKPGIIFRDITPVLSNPELSASIVKAMAALYRDRAVDVVAGIEARGFIFGSMLAHELGCSFVPIRKAGKLPFRTRRERYDLEYGSAEIEVHIDAFPDGSRVIIHDDLLATGGTACAAGELVRSAGASIVAFSFLINLSFLDGAVNIEKRFGITPDFLVAY